MRMTDPIATRPVPLDQIDLYAAELYRTGEPHAAWSTLRAHAPVWRQTAPNGTPFWSLTRYHDVARALRDVRTFSSEHSTMLSSMDGDIAKGKAIHLTDPPRHGALRGPTVGALSTRVMRTHGERIRERVARLVRSGVERGEVDFAELVELLPMAVAGDIIGIPEECWTEAAHWTLASVAPEDPAYLTRSPQETLMQAHVYLLTLFTDLIQRRRKEPTGDLVSLLTGLEIDGRPATDEEVMVNCYGFLIGSNITTPQVASHLVLILAERPELWSKIRDDPSLGPGTVDEMLRWATPTNHLLRRSTVDARFGDELVPAGSLVCAWVASANRDEEVFADPFVFDPHRRPNPHLTFGAGPHRCIGDSTARVGLSILVAQLAEQVASFEVTGPVTHLRSNFLNGVTRLPVALRPADRS